MTDLRKRLALICGLFGSHHDGERAAAASKAHDIVQELGVAWDQILVLPEGKAEMAEVRHTARTLLRHPDLFSISISPVGLPPTHGLLPRQPTRPRR